MGSQQGKRSYTITCSSEFRDAVLALAHKRGANAADIARSIILVLPRKTVMDYPDPGGPGREDREDVVLKSGPSAGRPWQRKPRLQIRMVNGFDSVYIRRALAIALDMDAARANIELEAPGIIVQPKSRLIKKLEDRIERLNGAISNLAFDPLPHGVQSREEALYVLGYAPGLHPTMSLIRSRFRTMATIHHPDGDQGSHQRMSQLNEAMDFLKRDG